MSRELPELAPLIDHALLDPHQGHDGVHSCCEEARHFGFGGACLPSSWIATARQWLPVSGHSRSRTPRLVAVVGFPFGAVPAPVKQAEAEFVAAAGADELDVVPNFSALADHNSKVVLEELAEICELGLPVKVILEVARLDPEALALLVEISIDAGVRFLKTGSGFGPPVTVEQVIRLRELARGRAGVKASGGITSLQQALDLVEAGATRLGTSRSVSLMQSLQT